MCWLVLPILTSYLDSCEFTFWDKLRYSLKLNMIYYVVEIGAVLVFGILYFALKDGANAEGAKGLLMALASAWALVQIILFLSNGIIDVPRDLWRRSSNKLRLKTVCCMMTQGQDILEEDRMTIEQCVEQLQAIEIVTTVENKAYINKIYEIIPEELTSFRSMTGAISPDVDVGTSHKETREKIADLHYKMKSCLHEYAVHKEYLAMCSMCVANTSGSSWRGYSCAT